MGNIVWGSFGYLMMAVICWYVGMGLYSIPYGTTIWAEMPKPEKRKIGYRVAAVAAFVPLVLVYALIRYLEIQIKHQKTVSRGVRPILVAAIDSGCTLADIQEYLHQARPLVP